VPSLRFLKVDPRSFPIDFSLCRTPRWLPHRKCVIATMPATDTIGDRRSLANRVRGSSPAGAHRADVAWPGLPRTLVDALEQWPESGFRKPGAWFMASQAPCH